MNKIKVVIIDDDKNFSSSLKIMMLKNFNDLEVVGIENSLKSGIDLINSVKPELIFLDINLPDGFGYNIIDNIMYDEFDVIFTTSHTEFVVKAFELSAIYYLLKPIQLTNLIDALNKFKKKNYDNKINEQLLMLKESLSTKPQKIILPNSDGNSIYNIDDIVRCEANSSYCMVYLQNCERVLISKPLQSLSKILHDFNFVRIHSKHLINLKYVKKYNTGRNSTVLLIDNTELQISQQLKLDFVEKIKKFIKIN